MEDILIKGKQTEYSKGWNEAVRMCMKIKSTKDKKSLINFIQMIFRNDKTAHTYDGSAGVGKRFKTPKEIAQDMGEFYFADRNIVFEKELEDMNLYTEEQAFEYWIEEYFQDVREKADNQDDLQAAFKSAWNWHI